MTRKYLAIWEIYVDQDSVRGTIRLRDWGYYEHNDLIAEMGSPGATNWDHSTLLF